MNGRLLLAAVIFAAQPLWAQTSSTLCDGYFPNGNLMQVPIGDSVKLRKANGVAVFGTDRTRYDWVLDKIEKIYKPKITAMGGQFVVNRMWTTNEVNASAEQYGRQYIINMYGGLARHKDITEEGFVLVACHETGHHLGGAPKIMRDWASNEGASDYYSTLKCIRWFYEGEDNETWAKTANVDAFAVARCQAQFSNRNDQLYCMRSAAGAQSIAATFANLDGVANNFKFTTPDSKVVRRTDDSHPDTQCRMDTLFNGATCTADANAPLSDSDPKVGACTQGVDTFGWRPLCWFKP